MALNVPLVDGRLYIIPLGGLGEIGKNMMAFIYGDEMILVDAGVMFPKEEMLGVDLILPDFQFVLEHRDKVKALFLTHGHEDHIGAVWHILRKLQVPVYGTRLTLALVKGKSSEHPSGNLPQFHEITPGIPVGFKHFSVNSYSNVHSIYDGVGLVIQTPIGKIVHSGDFKFDPTPVSGMATDFKTLAELGKEGVLLLLSDSTYAERPGYSLSEKVVRKSFDQIFPKAKGRIILATFASSFPRLQQAIDMADRYERKICFIGKRMVENVRIAREIGQLFLPDGMTVSEEELSTLPDSKVLILTTGSQGEPLSALSLMAAKSHKSVQISAGDTVIISATPIPGNEGLVLRTINQLYRLGAEVIFTLTTKQNEGSEPGLPVHVQGHAGQEELKFFIHLLKPKFFIPIHGEYRHLVQHVRLACDVGVAPENALIAVDGDVIEVGSESIQVVHHIPMTSMLVHGYGVGELSKSVMKERRALGEDGVLIVALTLKRGTLDVVGGPELVTKGFISDEAGEEILEEAKKVAIDFLNNGSRKAKDLEILKGNLKGELNRFFGEKMGRKPVIVPVFTWV